MPTLMPRKSIYKDPTASSTLPSSGQLAERKATMPRVREAQGVDAKSDSKHEVTLLSESNIELPSFGDSVDNA